MFRAAVSRTALVRRSSTIAGGQRLRQHGVQPVSRRSQVTSSGQSEHSGAVLGIRREDNTVWERRAPLSPGHVRQLAARGVRVIVQPSDRRAFPSREYEKAGAIINEDLSEAPIILGVKSVPIDLLEPHKTYAFFSHTIKAQEANMPLLDAILEKNIRLIDYEKIVDETTDRRLVAFGKYAGVAGMINILHGLGLRLLALGHHTPFMYVGPAHNYRNSYVAQAAIREAGYEIALGYMPKSIGPLLFVFTGSGNVSQGAQEMFRNLPHEYISINNLQSIKHGSTDVLYACVVDMEDNLERKSDGGFNRDEYIQFPERYKSTFNSKIGPYASVIVNGIYWAPGAPRLITIPDAKELLRPKHTPWIPTSAGCPPLPHRLLAICDISADPGGSIEFMKECTTINHPFQLYDAEQHIDYESFSGDGVLICSIDNMPAQLPRESTEFFGGLLLPHVYEMLKSDAKAPFDKFDATPAVKNAVITSNGQLTPNFEYIAEMRTQKRERSAAKSARREAHKSVLLLGAGFVSAPVVDYLTRDKNINVTVAAHIESEVEYLASQFPNTTPVFLEVDRRLDELEKLVSAHDLVISLLPYTLHPEVAKLAIKCQVNMVTASYRSPAMMELDQAAKDAGVTIVNEVGVDPGIDHMLAMQCFDDVRIRNGKIQSFVSWCGGIPAPEVSENPLRYKFNWSPRGVLFNMLSSARYLENGKMVDIPGNGKLMSEGIRDLDFMPGFSIEGYPNRDSMIYQKLYGLDDVHTLLRGTIRYKGFSRTAQGLLDIGLIDTNPSPFLHPSGPDMTWRAYMCELFGKKHDLYYDTLRDLVYERVGKDDFKLESIESLGLLDKELIDKKSTPLDTLTNYLAKKLAYVPGERDVLIMRHDVGVEWPDRKEETIHVNFVIYGSPTKYSAMAATVGFPTGIAAKMVLEGEIQGKGMVLPFDRGTYRPILKRLETEGLIARETSTVHRLPFTDEGEAVRF